ncbi:hypothetical protein CXZ10_07385 [Pleomorphomonas diazotrophica]|uniref:Uncharacterized protein n=1 Tax=Pleomorphomonas diazotrophica TaxID=1166257 RepID=A0A1I4UYD9_9HYPH|nr:hypothetical protein [Pleomorphomonas diazotrophica]PKR89713.1 hypothetical protein CXZ10_07385 [Pleomorphomonas diazotrophica]SFM93885.1 hypothetical protein SAMN05192571_109170 [Pleomorphomonas diazotrophica]
MRYIHHDVTAICDFIAGNNLNIIRLPPAEQNSSEIFRTANVEDMLEKSHKLWGTNLDYFFIVTDGDLDNNMDIKKAIEYTESGKIRGFLLAAYQDGGIISVSNKVYPFQEGAEMAAWWYV